MLLAASVLALSGCGRKGPLDLPPTGSQSQSQSSGSQSSPSSGYQPSTTQSSVTEPTDTDAQRTATPSVFNSTYGTETGPVAPRGAKRSFVLDPRLGN